jgi:hypothetical protein
LVLPWKSYKRDKLIEKPKVRDAAREVPLSEIKEPRESLEVIDKEHVEEEMLFDNG